MTRRIVGGEKDENGIYKPLSKAPEPPAPASEGSINANVTIDGILKTQIAALHRVTAQLMRRATDQTTVMTKDEIQSLATCIKVTLDLKEKEKELLDGLSDEELEKVASDANSSGSS